MPLSQKQILSFNEATKRFNIWVGAVRSGKTFASILKLIDLIKNGPDGAIMIIGVSRETIQRNILVELYRFLGFSPPSSKTNETKLYGRNIYFCGANDEGAVRKIQGATLAAAYVDEATCIPPPFWKMLLSRLSIPNAQLLATCNPEGPNHWLKKDFLDREHDLSLASWNFNLDDNPSLDDSFKENLKREYTGMWYKRYILGEWAVAHGLIYDSYDHDNLYEHPKSNPNYYIVGIDYGTSNATAAVLCAITPQRWPQICVEAEYYYDSVKKGRSKTDAELADDIYEFVQYKNISAVYVDPSAASLKIELRNRNLPVLDAKNDILPGIKITSKFISNKNLVIHKSCANLIDTIQSYCWDPRAADRGEDIPLKKREHICVTWDTEILTKRGYKKISSLAGMHKTQTLLNYNLTSEKIEYDIGRRIKCTQRLAEIYELELNDGKILRATGDHEILTQRGYIQLQHLMLSDMIVTCNINSTSTENST